MGAVSNSRTTEYSQTADKPKLVRRFAFSKPEVLQKTSGFFYFTKKERSKCTSPARRPSTAWRPSCSDRPVEINEAAAGSVGCIRSAKRTAIAGSASTTEKRKAALSQSGVIRRKEISMRKTVTELAMPEQSQRLIRLAPYTRVSSGSDDQLHSFAAQVKYYTGSARCRTSGTCGDTFNLPRRRSFSDMRAAAFFLSESP